MSVSGSLKKTFRLAIQGAFTTPAELDRVLKEELDIQRGYRELTGDGAYPEIVSGVIDAVEAQGRLREMTTALESAVPGNAELAAACKLIREALQDPIDPSPPAAPVDLVLVASKAEQDERLLRELLVHLGPSAKANKISIWHAGKVEYGDAIAATAARVESAAVIAVLVSATLLVSEEHEALLERAHARSRAGKAALVPVLLSQSNWKETALQRLQALPRNEKPVMAWSDRDAAWVEVARGLASVVLARRVAA